MTRMTNACRLLAEHIKSLPIEEGLYPELIFLRKEFMEMLLEKGNQEELMNDFVESQEDQKVLNPWLLELTKNYFK